MRRTVPIAAGIVLFSLTAAQTSHADEFKLKDGSTIIGTVVGYVGTSFKVKTSYGYALVEKDKIVSIKIASASGPQPENKSKTEALKSPAAEKSAIKPTKHAGAEEHASEAKAVTHPPAAPAPKPKPEDVTATNPPAASTANANTTPTANSAPNASAGVQPTAAASAPSTPPEPQPIREKISGNTYINDTYAFEMYKPPDWQVMDGARSVLPGAVAAMGTDDQSTYLVVGQEVAGKSTAADIAATEKRLGDILVNFRPLDDEHLTISGKQVIAHRFRGSVDEHDWSGFMVFMPRGEKLYTIFGMTRADNDLVQIQENVIRRTITSFQFLPQ